MTDPMQDQRPDGAPALPDLDALQRLAEAAELLVDYNKHADQRGDVGRSLDLDPAFTLAWIAATRALVARIEALEGLEVEIHDLCPMARRQHLLGASGSDVLKEQIKYLFWLEGERGKTNAELRDAQTRIEALVAERDRWMETAAQHCRNEEFWRGLVHQTGAHFGPAAYTADDGSVGDSVLGLKVPELAAALVAEVARLKGLLDKAAPHICPSCGPHARVDEEGCCAACGDDTHLDAALTGGPR